MSQATAAVSSCDSATRSTKKYFDRAMLTQSVGVTVRVITIKNNRCLSKPNNLLATLSSNGKEKLEEMRNLFNEYFKIKNDACVIVSILKRGTSGSAR